MRADERIFTSLSGLFEGRIYPHVLPTDVTEKPSCVYDLNSRDADFICVDDPREAVTVTLNFLHDDYENVRAIARSAEYMLQTTNEFREMTDLSIEQDQETRVWVATMSINMDCQKI